MSQGGNTVPSITNAEHIGPNDTGDNIEAKRVANYTWDSSTQSWVRASDNGSTEFSTSTSTTVGASATSVTLKAANANRKELVIRNDSSAILYIEEGSPATTSSVFKLNQDDYYSTNNYTGIVTGIWTAATGNAQVKES